MRRRRALLCIALFTASTALAPSFARAGAPSLTPQSIASAGVTLEVPSGWASVTPTAKLQAQHVVAVCRARHALAGFLNVIEATVPAGTTLHQWFLGNRPSTYLALGSLRPETIGGAHALAYTSSQLDAVAGKQLLVVEYGFLVGGQAFLFTYTAPAGRGARAAEALFAASAATIRFGSVPGA